MSRRPRQVTKRRIEAAYSTLIDLTAEEHEGCSSAAALRMLVPQLRRTRTR